MDNYTLRHAKDEDAPQISNLIFGIWTQEYGFKVEPQDYPDLQQIETSYPQKGGAFWVATLGEEVIGTVACDRLIEGVFVLKRMFVRDSFRGKGIAQALFDKLLSSFSSGATFYLSTKEDAALAAKKFYLRNGFEVIKQEELPQGFPFFYEDDLFMRKEL